jgi:acyl carrier protein
MSIRPMVFAEIRSIAEQQGKVLAPLSDDLPLLESGLDSLCVAVLVARLNDRAGFDPFAREFDIPVTIGDIVKLYENAPA